MSFMDWNPPTPRLPSSPDVAARQGGGARPAASRPLSFACVGGDVVWQTYPGHLVLTLDQARDVRQIIVDELTNDRLAGGGNSTALGLLLELQTAINAARRWRQCQGAA